MYKFYKNNDEMTGERSEPYFNANEAYYIDSDNLKVINENYTVEEAEEFNRQREIHDILYGGDSSQMYRLYDPTDHVYDHVYARVNATDGYKKLENQLDMLYWDKINNTDNWVNHINYVKNKYPKSSL